MIRGGHVQWPARTAPVLISDLTGADVIAANAPMSSDLSATQYISLTRTKNPAWHRGRDNYDGEGQAERHSQKRLKVRTIKRTAAFFRCAALKAPKFHESSSKPRHRKGEA